MNLRSFRSLTEQTLTRMEPKILHFCLLETQYPFIGMIRLGIEVSLILHQFLLISSSSGLWSLA